MLESVLVGAQILPPYISHVAYENLHPFTDGNGRSGRALWLWQMMHGTMRQVNMARDLGFLHTFYYQTLNASDGRTPR